VDDAIAKSSSSSRLRLDGGGGGGASSLDSTLSALPCLELGGGGGLDVLFSLLPPVDDSESLEESGSESASFSNVRLLGTDTSFRLVDLVVVAEGSGVLVPLVAGESKLLSTALPVKSSLRNESTFIEPRAALAVLSTAPSSLSM
jgi:hypothetical protein